MQYLDNLSWTEFYSNLSRMTHKDRKTYKSLFVFCFSLSLVMFFLFWPMAVLSLLACSYFFYSFRKAGSSEFLIADFVIERRERYERFNSKYYNPQNAESIDISSKIFYLIPQNLQWFVLTKVGLKTTSILKNMDHIVVYEFMYKKILAGERVSFILTPNFDTIAYIFNHKVYYMEKTKILSDGSSITLNIGLSQEMGKGKSFLRNGLHDYERFINE